MNAIRALLCVGGILAVLLGGQGPAQASRLELRLGIMPFATSTELVHIFAPLQDHLEAELDVSVSLSGAVNYRAFMAQLERYQVDFAFLAPHLALLAAERARWTPLVRSTGTYMPVLVVRKDSPIQSIANLRNRTVVLPDSISLVALASEMELARFGLVEGQTVGFQYSPTHGNALALVANKKADAAVVAPARFHLAVDSVKRDLHVVATFARTIGLIFMVSPRVGGSDRNELQQALLIPEQTASGRAYLKKIGHSGYVPLKLAELERFRDLLAPLTERLQQEGEP